MRELEILDIIQKNLNNSDLIGDDCAYLKDLDTYITQDTLVEDVHFSRHTISPYQLGRKAVSVNLSDIACSLAKALYISISLSIPKNVKNNFVDELYRGINDVCSEYGVNVSGGDITGSDKIVISICALAKRNCDFLTSRSFAKKGDYILVTGNFGASAAGFHSLSNFLYAEQNLINAHLNPTPKLKEAYYLSKIINENIAAMDCSDGLIDALYKISLHSKHTLCVDFNKIPVLKELKDYCNRNKLDYKHLVKWGAEDYELIVCVNEETYKKIDKNLFTLIGRVHNKDKKACVVITDKEKEQIITKEIFEKNTYNHFA